MRKFFCILFALLLLVFVPVTGFADEENQGGQNQQDQTDSPPCAHSYTYSSNGETHTGTCTLCTATTEPVGHTYDVGTVVTPATCTAAGEKTLTCTACSATKQETIAALGHSYQTVNVDSTNHKMTCGTCQDEVLEGHAWNAGETVTAATCQAAGKKVYTCTKCSATKEEVLGVLTTHTYSAWESDSENHTRTCSVCAKVDTGKHAWGVGTVITEATCKDAGLVSYTCSGCNVVLYEDVEKKTTHTYDNNCDATCNVCEVKRDAAHKFSEVWYKSSVGHWYACLACGQEKEILDHVPGPAATEQKEQTCLTCGYVLKARLNHVHSAAREWKSDKNGHWHNCSGCEVELDFERHNYGTGCDGCKVCGYVDPTKHIYDGIWELDKFSHWGTCTVCGEVSELQDHIPGPEASKDGPQTCTVCGYVIAEYQEHDHMAAGEWLHNDAEHWRLCECGEKMDVDPHIWDEGARNKDKTVTYNCAMCDEVKVEPYAKEESSFPWEALLVILIIMLIAAFGTLAWIILQPKQKGKFTER